MEHLTRTLSWTFVFGAIAALVYTSFKPAWTELAGGDISEAQLRGTLIAKDEQAERKESPRPTPVDCESAEPSSPDACNEQKP